MKRDRRSHWLQTVENKKRGQDELEQVAEEVEKIKKLMEELVKSENIVSSAKEGEEVDDSEELGIVCQWNHIALGKHKKL